MRITLNLATKPFVELRPLLLRLRVIMGVLAVLAVGLGFWLHSLNRQATVAEAQLDDVRAKTTAFESLRRTDEAKMRQPQNAAVLDRSRFLNAVFARKSFSWTAVMMDLERVLPAGVQVTSIEPQVLADGAVNIRLRVSGDRDRAVQLVRNLETSSRFLQPRLAGEAAQAAEGSGGARPVSTNVGGPAQGGVEFEIYSGYNPLPKAMLTKSSVGQGSQAGIPSVPSGHESTRPPSSGVTRPYGAPIGMRPSPSSGRPSVEGRAR